MRADLRVPVVVALRCVCRPREQFALAVTTMLLNHNAMFQVCGAGSPSSIFPRAPCAHTHTVSSVVLTRMVLGAVSPSRLGVCVCVCWVGVVQASVTIALLFLAYVLHVRYQPFLPVKSVSRKFATMGAKRRGGQVLRQLPAQLAAEDADKSAADGPQGAGHSSSSAPSSSGQGPKRRQSESTSASRMVQLSLQARSRLLSFVVDYNTLESSFLISSMFILLGGMVFSSAAFKRGSVAYVILTVLVTAMIVISTSVFVYLLVFEVFRAIRYSSLHRAAAEAEAAAATTAAAGEKVVPPGSVDAAGDGKTGPPGAVRMTDNPLRRLPHHRSSRRVGPMPRMTGRK